MYLGEAACISFGFSRFSWRFEEARRDEVGVESALTTRRRNTTDPSDLTLWTCVMVPQGLDKSRDLLEMLMLFLDRAT
jgi:hypothetical protein